MDIKREFMRVLTSSQEQSEECVDLNSCTRCVEREACQWCRDARSNASGSCQKSGDGCGTNAIPESDCPNVGPDAIMTNISGLIVAMLGIVICLNVLNRCSNKRRRYTRKRSIFKLPVYRYPLREERLTEMPQQDALPDSINDVENGGLHAEENCAATCTICLSPYQHEELVKVLPCKHEFHADCLDRWLERKANCPLCKAHAFSKEWGGSRRNAGRSHRVRLLIPPVRAVADGLARGLRVASRSRYETTSHGRQNPTEDTAGVRSVSRGNERGAVQNGTQGAAFENGGEEITREETKTVYGEGPAVVTCSGGCHREVVGDEDSFDATLAERVDHIDTQGAPQPPSSGVDEGQHTGRRTPLVENQNTAEEANALR